MNQDEAKGIFLQALPELSEPLKSAVEFALANWHRLNREPRPSDVAINFFASLPALPTNTIDLKLAAKPNAMAKLLRDDPDVWYSLENLPHEEWRDIVGYEGLYQVSNYGRIKSFHGKGVRILIHAEYDEGYMRIDLTKNRKSEKYLVHVLVAKAFLPNLQNLPIVHHRDDAKNNPCVWNLAWVTRSENKKLAYQSGAIKSKQGHEHCNALLTPEQIYYIRAHYLPYDKTFGAHAFAEKFNVSPSTIVSIVKQRTYRNVI